ncbi:MAG: F0F1 ATP synthase subunit epsilon [bacterium]
MVEKTKARTFHLELILPDDFKIHRDVESIIAPGIDGYLGVLAGHAPLITSLKEGRLTIRFEGQVRTFMIGPGYLEVTRKQVIILTEYVKLTEEEMEDLKNWAIRYKVNE